MNKKDYINKMDYLLSDQNSYCEQRDSTAGIGSAPHRLAKHLAKPLSSSLGKISGTHLKNSTDLIDRLKAVDFKDKILVTADVISLFTHVPISGAINAVKEVLDYIDESDLPLNKRDYIKLIELCFNFGSFSFNQQEFRQHEGLPMGSPLSAVAASLFMETLEKDHYSKIIDSDSKWYRYVDDCLIVTHKDTNTDLLLQKLNEVHNKIQFTTEKEIDGSLPFLDTVIMRTDESVKFKSPEVTVFASL
ncbi:uncharacterized protein LOC143025928 [Oratosquilla oratoria]|uniref:uncharacterized protein LOC143025928 n=1 Tax=Oratosquilla oratoria TaxID=337810 RepID=UPI003F75FAE2